MYDWAITQRVATPCSKDRKVLNILGLKEPTPKEFARKLLGAAWQRAPRRTRWRFLSGLLGLEPDLCKQQMGIPSMWGALELLARNGINPGTVIDVGAWRGEWAHRAAGIFKNSRFLLLEANPDHEPSLRELCSRHPGIDYRLALLGAKPRSAVTFHIPSELAIRGGSQGGSIFPEVTAFPQLTKKLPMVVLDDVAHDLAGPLLVKLDVQGSELEVMAGGREVLARSDALVVETALIEYNAKAPQFAEVISQSAAHGFVCYDIGGQFRRNEDSALFQVDLVLVRESSLLRSPRRFWATEQSFRRH